MFDENTVSLIAARANRAIGESVFPGCVVGVVTKNGERMILPFGRFTYENGSSAMQDCSVFDVASVTKSIPLSSLLLRLIDGKKVSLDDAVADYVPEFGNFPEKKAVTMRHLLSYTLDLDVPAMSSLKEKAPDEMISAIISAPLRRPAGTTYLYTNSTACVMGLVVRNASGRDIDALAEYEFFSPLEMRNSTFHPKNADGKRIVPTEFDSWRNRLICGEVHDESAWVLGKKYILGIAGLFSTAPDMLSFLEMLLRKGECRGVRYFSENIVTEMGTNQIPEIKGEYAGLGWELFQPWFMGRYAGPHTFGKTGFTGTCVVCDVERGVAYTILSNRTFPKRPENSSAINAFRADIGDIIFSAHDGS